MGYVHAKPWIDRVNNLAYQAALAPRARVLAGVQLTIENAVRELEWKIAKSPEFGESGSIARVLEDLREARAGLERLDPLRKALRVKK